MKDSAETRRRARPSAEARQRPPAGGTRSRSEQPCQRDPVTQQVKHFLCGAQQPRPSPGRQHGGAEPRHPPPGKVKRKRLGWRAGGRGRDAGGRRGAQPELRLRSREDGAGLDGAGPNYGTAGGEARSERELRAPLRPVSGSCRHSRAK